MSYIAEHQSVTQKNGASHKKVIICLAKIATKSVKSVKVSFCKLEVV